jgi:hypothetical protein
MYSYIFLICLKTDPQIRKFFVCLDDNEDSVYTQFNFEKWVHLSANFETQHTPISAETFLVTLEQQHETWVTS